MDHAIWKKCGGIGLLALAGLAAKQNRRTMAITRRC